MPLLPALREHDPPLKYERYDNPNFPNFFPGTSYRRIRAPSLVPDVSIVCSARSALAIRTIECNAIGRLAGQSAPRNRVCVPECVLGRGFMFEGMRYCLSFMQMKADDRKNKYILH